MTIPPALTKEEWAFADRHRALIAPEILGDPMFATEAAKVIATNNAALPDGDPRKITWAMVDALQDFAETIPALLSGTQAPFRALADALASYLPPRETPA